MAEQRELTFRQMLDRGLIEVRGKYPRKNAKNPPPPVDLEQVQAAFTKMLRDAPQDERRSA